MKIANKNKSKNDKKKKQIDKPKKEKVRVVAQEIKFARLLSSNEKQTRDRVLKTCKKWFFNCFQREYEFKEYDFIRVWKGIFYAVWMSDKPLMQEELCETIASLLDMFPAEQFKHAMLMTKAGFRVLATEWFGIDQHRMDKFLMLVRRYLRGSMRCLQRCDWSMDNCRMYGDMLSKADGLFAAKTPHYARNATSMLLHIIDCYLEEMAKVSQGNIPEESVAELLEPFCKYVCLGENPTLCAAARRLLTALMRQSDAGLEYQEATQAWKRMGCPAGGPHALEKIVNGDDSDEDQDNWDGCDLGEDSGGALDPRAGRVDVLLPTLPAAAGLLAASLRRTLPHAKTPAQRRTRLCLHRFEQLAKGQYPLMITDTVDDDEEIPVIKPTESAKNLISLETKLKMDADELKLRGLSRKHRKRLLNKSRAGLSIVEDVEKPQETTKISSNGDWQVEATQPEAKRKDDTDKENQQKKNKDRQPNKKRKIDAHAQNGDVNNKKQKLDRKAKSDSKKDVNNKVKEIKNNKKDTNKEVKLDKVVNGDLKKPKDRRDTTKTIILRDKGNANKKEIMPNVNQKNNKKKPVDKKTKAPTIVASKLKSFQKQLPNKDKKDGPVSLETPKKVKFVLKNNSMQAPVDYYKSVRQSPSIPFDSSRKPSKTNLKPSTPSPINPFFKKKSKLRSQV